MIRYILAVPAMLIIVMVTSFAHPGTTFFNMNAETGNMLQWFPDGWVYTHYDGGDIDTSGSCGSYCPDGNLTPLDGNEWAFVQNQIVHSGTYAYATLLKNASNNWVKLETWQKSGSSVSEAWWSLWLYILKGQFQGQDYSFKSTSGINIIQWKSRSDDNTLCPGLLGHLGPPLIVIEAYEPALDPGNVHIRVIDWPYVVCSNAPPKWSVPPNPDAAIPSNQWVNLRFHIKFANNNQGFFEAWRDGIQIWDVHNINTAQTCMPGQPIGSIACDKVFFGVGMYASPNEANYQAVFLFDTYDPHLRQHRCQPFSVVFSWSKRLEKARSLSLAKFFSADLVRIAP